MILDGNSIAFPKKAFLLPALILEVAWRRFRAISAILATVGGGNRQLSWPRIQVSWVAAFVGLAVQFLSSPSLTWQSIEVYMDLISYYIANITK